MLVIPTYVEKSEINGFGLFAARDIEEGEVIWLFDPNADILFTEQEFENMLKPLNNEIQERIKGWSYKRGNTFILCADNSNFWNHSETNANCGGPSPTYTIALKNIKADEELLENYKEYDKTSEEIEGELYDTVSERTEGTERNSKSRETNGKT